MRNQSAGEGFALKKAIRIAVLTAFLLAGCGRPAVPEPVQETGEFVGIEEIADTENGRIMVPSTFVRFRESDAGITGLTQCADPGGENIITLEYYRGYAYTEVYSRLRRELAGSVSTIQFSDEDAPVLLGSYHAHQILCRYEKNGRELDMGIWIIEDPDAAEPSCYYLAIEVTQTHLDWLDLAQTFQTRRDFLTAS